MEAQHFKTIINKIKNKDINEIQFVVRDKKLNLVTVNFEKYRVTVEKSNSDIFSISIKNMKDRHEQRFHFEPFFIKFLSPSWRTWRSLGKVLEKIKKAEQDKEQQRLKDIDNQNLNELLVEVFPEIIEDELLGE